MPSPSFVMLNDMLHAVAVIERVPERQFFNDEVSQSAIFYNLIVLGEAAGDLIREFPDIVRNARHIPFYNARTLRNRLAHDYTGVDLAVMWRTLERVLPQFKADVRELIQSLDR